MDGKAIFYVTHINTPLQGAFSKPSSLCGPDFHLATAAFTGCGDFTIFQGSPGVFGV